eukprot:gnl/TRDRNA2_/TRDRNA2_138867_c0_seq2.p1 gnl/TRDRNA2_/TRDRNA2_138867_c0~~gnl/TRDRNA2_/TRDRNA2_138867_c0_seq2.p1  ORF type:complete len:295 (-),score=19.18 gnl/TRDRNA2_/TRDRNA2_138867_c0_seq2:92-976(-)
MIAISQPYRCYGLEALVLQSDSTVSLLCIPTFRSPIQRPGSDSTAIRREGNSCNRLLVAFACEDATCRCCVPHLGTAVRGRGGDMAPTWRECRRDNRAIVTCKYLEALPAVGVPEPRRAIFGCRSDEAAVQRKNGRLHFVAVPCQRSETLAILCIPQLNAAVPRSSDNVAPIWREACRRDDLIALQSSEAVSSFSVPKFHSIVLRACDGNSSMPADDVNRAAIAQSSLSESRSTVQKSAFRSERRSCTTPSTSALSACLAETATKEPLSTPLDIASRHAKPQAARALCRFHVGF